jgi:tRNA nucleotidyltransferase (CCA-adding enzyme)
VKRKIIPNAGLRSLVLAKAEEIRSRVEGECEQAAFPAEVRIDGSVAKDTWLRGNADVDIFMRVSPELTKQELRDVCLPIAKRALQPNKIVERYAEHPYVESTLSLSNRHTLRVNIVPCYNVEMGHWQSATDRSPYHTEYMLQHLTQNQRDEVRLLKAFLRGIGSYGADIKTGGFSGMLSETLITSQGDFRRVVEEFTNWQRTDFIDLEGYYGDRAEDVRRIFQEPLVVIDPVDRGRNLGAAVREEQLWNFVAACRSLLKTPTISFFSERKPRPITLREFQRILKDKRSTMLCVVTGRIGAVVDILWSQLYRTERALITLLENNDFNVLRSLAWSDEKALNVILLELEQADLAFSRKHMGPPVCRVKESDSFLSKHMKNARTVAGPWIEGERWAVEREREAISAISLLTSSLKSGGREIGIASLLSESFRKRTLILKNESIARLVSKNEEFAGTMRSFMTGRPVWLD